MSTNKCLLCYCTGLPYQFETTNVRLHAATENLSVDLDAFGV